MENNIYRIISFPSFVNLITKKEERFVHPTQWDDTYEGIFFAIQRNPEKCEELLRKLCEKSGDLNKVISNFVKCLYFPLFSYAQCWSKEADTDAMWRIYNYENMSVRICTTDECWQNILQNKLDSAPSISDYNLVIKDVEYDLSGDSSTIINMLQEKVLTDGDLCDIYFHKRPAFRHEAEKRVLIFNRAGAGVVNFFEQFPINNEVGKLCENNYANTTIETVVQAVKNCLSDKKMDLNSAANLYVDLSDIDLKDYIKSVKLNPFAPDWIDELVMELCQRNGLNYEGKSTLYDIV